MKTIREWLNELPDGYCERALANTAPDCLECRAGDLEVALCSAFEWSQSPEGYEFWLAVADHYEARPPLPPLPEKEGKS